MVLLQKKCERGFVVNQGQTLFSQVIAFLPIILKPLSCSQTSYAQNPNISACCTEKGPLDNTTDIQYLNPSRLLPQYDCCLISAPTTYYILGFKGLNAYMSKAKFILPLLF